MLTTDNFLHLLSTFGDLFHTLASFGNFFHLSATFRNFCTTFVNCKHLWAHFGIFQLANLVACKLVRFSACASWSLRACVLGTVFEVDDDIVSNESPSWKCPCSAKPNLLSLDSTRNMELDSCNSHLYKMFILSLNWFHRTHYGAKIEPNFVITSR